MTLTVPTRAQMDYPNDTDVLETFECFQPCTNS